MGAIPLKAVRIAEGAEVENSTAEAVLDSYTIPAGALRTAGVGYRIDFLAIVNDNNSTDTLTTRLRVGPTTLTGTAAFASAAVDVADTDMCTGYIIVMSLGLATAGDDTSGEIAVWGMATNPDLLTGIASEGFGVKIGSIDVSAALRVELTAEWSVAHADNEVAPVGFNVQELAG